MSIEIINESDIDSWARTISAKADFPELILRLIHASVGLPERISFPTGAAVYRQGFDGILINKDTSCEFIPFGNSIWEISTDSDVAKKAWNDFEKRKTEPLPDGFIRLDTTYVAVTSNRFSPQTSSAKKENTRDGFIAKAKTHQVWKDVRVIDRDDILVWLLDQPGVALWLQGPQKVGKLPKGILIPDRELGYFRHRSNPPVSLELLLADREEQVSEFMDRLKSPSGPILIKADSPQEAQAFVISAIKKIPDDTLRVYYESRTIIVKGQEIADRLPRGSRRPLIIILDAEAAEKAGALAADGHTVIQPLASRLRYDEKQEIRLSRQGRENFAKALQDMWRDEDTEVTEDKAITEARRCSRSITVFQRQHRNGAYPPPSWSTGAEAGNLLPAVLAGGWDEAKNEDKEVLRLLSGRPSYDEFRAGIRPLLRVDEPPIANIGTVWCLTAHADSFELLKESMTIDNLDRYRQSAVRVFGELNPALDLPMEERPYASLRGAVLAHSDWLRDGLANTLLLMSALGDDKKFPGNIDFRRLVDGIVTELPSLRNDPRLWFSLSRSLQVLCEAAPDAFLGAMESLLQGDAKELRTNFFPAQDNDFLGGGNPVTTILWALQRLAWDPELLMRVAALLLRLAELDPGGNVHPRPVESITDIIEPQLPASNAKLDERLSMLNWVLEKNPSIGWKILIQLIPTQRMITVPHCDLLWREAGRSDKEIITYGLLKRAYDGIFERIVRYVESCPDRWTDALEDINSIYPEFRGRLYVQLEELLKTDLDGEDRRTLVEALRRVVSTNTAFGDADWALPKAEVERIRHIMESGQPKDLVARHAWLFNDYRPSLPVMKNHVLHRESLNKLRRDGIIDIYKAEQLGGLRRLIRSVKIPGLISSYVFDVLANEAEYLTLLDEALALEGSAREAATEFSARGLGLYKDRWHPMIEAHAEARGWDDETWCLMLLGWPLNMETFHYVESRGEAVEKLFWSRLHGIWSFADDSPEALQYAVRKIIKAHRTFAHLDAIQHHAALVGSKLLIEALWATLVEVNNIPDFRPQQMFDWSIGQIVKALRSDPCVDRRTVQSIEFAFIPILVSGYGDNDEQQLELHASMASDSQFYIEVIKEVYKAASESKETEEEKNPSPQQLNRARHAYRLLNSLRKIPGTQADGRIDSGVLIDWLTNVRKLAAGADRTAVADLCVGNLFAYAPPDPDDGAWPHKAVRNAIEKASSSDIEQGMVSEQHAKRGVFSKSIDEGGKQERELAESVKGWMNTVGNEWPRTKSMLKNIAEMWDDAAKRADIEVKQQRMKTD